MSNLTILVLCFFGVLGDDADRLSAWAGSSWKRQRKKKVVGMLETVSGSDDGWPRPPS